MYQVKKNLFYLKKKFNIDLWGETLKKKNFRRKQTKRFLVRLERFFLLGGAPGIYLKKKKNLFWAARRKQDAFKNLNKTFKIIDKLNNQKLVQQIKFEDSFALYSDRQKKLNNFFNLFALKSYSKLKKIYKNRIKFNQNLFPTKTLLNSFFLSNEKEKNYSRNAHKDLKLYKYEIYARRFLPGKL